MSTGGLGNTRFTTDYAQKSPQTLHSGVWKGITHSLIEVGRRELKKHVDNHSINSRRNSGLF